MHPPLTDVEVRVLGSLLEKEATTPDNYPLSLNALQAACNQTTNREPVMQLDEDALVPATVALYFCNLFFWQFGEDFKYRTPIIVFLVILRRQVIDL